MKTAAIGRSLLLAISSTTVVQQTLNADVRYRVFIFFLPSAFRAFQSCPLFLPISTHTVFFFFLYSFHFFFGCTGLVGQVQYRSLWSYLDCRKSSLELIAGRCLCPQCQKLSTWLEIQPLRCQFSCVTVWLPFARLIRALKQAHAHSQVWSCLVLDTSGRTNWNSLHAEPFGIFRE